MTRDAETNVSTPSLVRRLESVDKCLTDVKRRNTRMRSNEKMRNLDDRGNGNSKDDTPMT
jgi:hypothetical protein